MKSESAARLRERLAEPIRLADHSTYAGGELLHVEMDVRSVLAAICEELGIGEDMPAIVRAAEVAFDLPVRCRTNGSYERENINRAADALATLLEAAGRPTTDESE